jgi:peptidoglycan hydrolase-like protein with peptidoglycan-binding domain
MNRGITGFLLLSLLLGCTTYEQRPSEMLFPQRSEGNYQSVPSPQGTEAESPANPEPLNGMSPPAVTFTAPAAPPVIIERPLPEPEVAGPNLPSSLPDRAPPAEKKGSAENPAGQDDTVLLNPAIAEDARVIQTRLSELRFYAGPIDGIWGRKSRLGLTQFKETHSLGASDTWNREVQDVLFRRAAEGKQTPEDLTQFSSGAVILDPAIPRDAMVIQKRLADAGLYTGTIDGIWGRGSRAGLRSFKEEHSLTNPDVWDKETQILLFGDTRR